MADVTEGLSLKGKIAIVTGAATGIGRSVAELFAKAGAAVAAGDVNTDGLASFSEAAYAGRLDVSDAASVRDFFAAVEARCGGVDVLVNVAGIYPLAPFETMDVELWDRVQAVNTRGVFLMCQQAIGAMRKRGGGSIVNISSINSMKGVISDNIHYAVSKAGVNAITVSMAREFAHDNIRSNVVIPGLIETDQAAKSSKDAEKMGLTLSGPMMQMERIPLTKGAGQPIDIANAVLFLASDASAYITGQLLAVDGGFLIS